jgi:beta-lactamase regulating signal transducer with metallopeptidase domain
MLAGIWGMVAVGQMLRLAAGFFYLWRLKRAARPAVPERSARFAELLRYCRVRRRARLLVSQRIGSPVAVGFFRPAVILPEPLARQLSPAELDHVLLHEMAHIARRDDWVQLAAAFLWSVLALHPVAAWVLRRIEREREIACDDWVVAATGAPQPYARSLARLFELCASRPVTILASGIGGRGSNLGDRIALLLERGRAFGTGVSLARVGGFALLLIGMAALAAHTPAWIALAQAPAPPTDPPREVRPGRESFLAGLVAAGYGDLPVDDIINLKNQGVTADYLLRMSRAGWGKLLPSIVIRLKQQGVDPDYVREIHSLGFGPYTPGLMINLKVHGVPVDLLQALKEYGIAQASAEELIDARNHGLCAQNLKEARTYGSHLTMRQLVRLKQAGVI